MGHSSPNEERRASGSKPGRRSRGWIAALVVGCAFAAGWWLGHGPVRDTVTHSGSPDAVATFFAGPEARDRNDGVLHARHQPARSSRRGASLRVRATERLSSERAQAGEVVMFRTEHAVRTRSGRHVPAGALVEGVVAGAAPSSARTAGQLVIEIRALHIGNRTIPLHALPFIPEVSDNREPAPADGGTRSHDPRTLGIRNQLRPYPEAVLPKEAVIELQLVEARSGKGARDDVITPGDPSTPAFPAPVTVPKPEITLPVPDSPLPESSPAFRGRRARIARG